MKQTLLLLFLFFSSLTILAQGNSNEWTWIGGDNVIPQYPAFGILGLPAASNKPGARQYAATWRDLSGNLWLFGGAGFASNGSGNLNDLWMYNILSGQWTWLGGSNTTNQAGDYGSRSIEASTNIPGARFGAVSWTDASGNLWLFGGTGAIYGITGYLNDLWKYAPSTGKWTWISGDNNINQPGIYGIKGMAASGNKPGGRYNAVSWKDASGNLWMFGGKTYSNINTGYSNDLWKYNPKSGQWTWMSGDNTTYQTGIYGTKGTGASGNRPGARYGAVSWADTSGNMWLFGGVGNTSSSLSWLNDLWKYNPATGLWTWMSGDNYNNDLGVYGTKGVGASTNKPGARQYAASWMDAANNLWLFGGCGYTLDGFGNLNDLWKYDPSTDQWTWLSGDNFANVPGVYGKRGTSGAANKPGTRNSVLSWTDTSGNFWMMGGSTTYNSSNGNLTDLWRYTPSDGLWAWMAGDNINSQTGEYGTKGMADSANTPGIRGNSVQWTDTSGDLWLFGGNGATSNDWGLLNDLWKYIPSAGKWTWVSGDNTVGQNSIYGTKGIPDIANKPGARFHAVSWRDASDNLWLYGGLGNSANSTGSLGDLWKFEPSNGQWTWMNGDNKPNQQTVYGNLGTAAAGNSPGARFGGISWKDASGNLWMFGGSGYTVSGSGYLNDLWKFTPSNGQWTWMGGDSTGSQQGVYGKQGIAAASNKPGGRTDAVSWSDASGNLWLFGGFGYAGGSLSYLNDLWKYQISTGQWTWVNGDNNISQSGVYGTKGKAAISNIPGARGVAVSWMDALGNLWMFGGQGSIAGQIGNLNDLWKYTPSTGLWTWVSGDNATYQLGIYGSRGIADSSNKPGARLYASGWADISGNGLWLFGGSGYGSNGFGNLNDLWKFTVPVTSLPVQFSSFTAKKQMQTVLLNWTTAQEQNSQYFIVERSSNGTVYDSIGNVAAMGTSISATSYSFIDKAPLPGNNFYRLKQVDKDGRFLYTGIAKVVMDEDTYRFVIMQNPVQNTLQLNMQLPSAQKLLLQIRDITGHLLLSEEKLGSQGTSVYSLPVERLTRGTYFVNIQTGDVSNTKTFIKQ